MGQNPIVGNHDGAIMIGFELRTQVDFVQPGRTATAKMSNSGTAVALSIIRSYVLREGAVASWPSLECCVA
jgi:hypothetical protein